MRAVGLLVFASEFSYLYHPARHAGGAQVGWVAHLGRRHTQPEVGGDVRRIACGRHQLLPGGQR
jgi:hypothetical protein